MLKDILNQMIEIKYPNFVIELFNEVIYSEVFKAHLYFNIIVGQM